MGAIGTGLIWLALIAQSCQVYAKDACPSQLLLSSTGDKNMQSRPLNPKECAQITFEGSDKLNTKLGSLQLKAVINTDNTYLLNISFVDIKWKKAYLRFSQEGKQDSTICKAYSINTPRRSHNFRAHDSCFNLQSYNASLSYILDFRAEFNTDILYKTLVFKLPDIESFGDKTPLPQRSVFSSIDTTSNYGIVQKIQPLPSSYNVTYYKVEVFKEKDNKHVLLDVRMLKPQGNKEELSFEYITYNEEGYYYFIVSAISDVCGEDECLKSSTPRIYIKRKHPPLVIGIVGASFLIPFVLFVLYRFSRGKQEKDEKSEEMDSVYLVYSQTPEKHYVIVKSLEKALKAVGNVKITPKISEASHILYVCGAHIFEPDPATHKYLVIEANKAISTAEILVIRFPYSTKEIPPYLRSCLRFNLMEDFSKFIHMFNCEAELEGVVQYQDLKSNIEEAQAESEPKKIILNMPVIIVTEQSDSEGEAVEGDVLL